MTVGVTSTNPPPGPPPEPTHGRTALSRRHFLLGGAAAVVALAVDGVLIEPNWIAVTRHTIGSLAPGAAPLHLVQLTDLHLHSVGGHEERVAAAVHALDPDVLVLTGDSIDRADGLAALRDFLALLPNRAVKVATLGNWEHWAGVDLDVLRRTYAAAGVQLLVNRSLRVTHWGRAVLISGVDDSTAGRPDVREALRGEEPAANQLLLAHSPLFRDQLLARNGSLIVRGEDFAGHSPSFMLSGHTHGGQVTLFGWAPLVPPGSGRYVRGWYRDPGRPPLYVSRGIGTSLVPVRLFATPEVASFQWHLRA